MADQHCPFCKTVLAYGTCVNTNCKGRHHTTMQALLSGQPSPGPIASRIADSYAALIERAEKAEREVERLLRENERVTARLNVAGAALNRLSCLGNGSLPGNSDGNVIAQDAMAAIRRIL